MARSIESQLRRVKLLLDMASEDLQSLETLNGARNPRASFESADLLVDALHGAHEETLMLRARFVGQIRRKKGGR